VSASPNAAPLAPAPELSPTPGAPANAETKPGNESERLQRLLKEQQDKTEALKTQMDALKTEADAAQAMRAALRVSAIEGHLREAGIARPDLMAKLFEVQSNFFGPDQKLTADGKKAADAFIAYLGDDLHTRHQASTPGLPKGPVTDPTVKYKPGSGFDVMNKMMKGQIR